MSVTKCWVAIRGVDYEGEELIGLYQSKESAIDSVIKWFTKPETEIKGPLVSNEGRLLQWRESCFYYSVELTPIEE